MACHVCTNRQKREEALKAETRVHLACCNTKECCLLFNFKGEVNASVWSGAWAGKLFFVTFAFSRVFLWTGPNWEALEGLAG